MFKYLQIIPSVNPDHGGPIEGVIQLASVTKELGWEVEIVSIDSPDAPFLSGFPLPVHALGPSRSEYHYSSKLEPWLHAHAKEYDGVIVNSIWNHVSFAAHRAMTAMGVPYILYTHGMLDPYFKTFRLKHLKKSLYWRWGQYPALRDAAAVCFTCEEEKILARQSFRPYQCNEVVVNYGTAGPTGGSGGEGAHLNAFLRRFPQLLGKRYLLFLSRLHPKKGCDILILAFAEALKHCPELQLVMAGPDQMGWQQELEGLARQRNLNDQILWTGMLKGEEKWGAFRGADAFILPSHQENFGIAVVEALACGTPVLISDKVNIWREIQQDRAGMVAVDTLEGTSQLILQWLALSSSEQIAMRESAYTCFRDRFEISKAGRDLVKVLTDYACT